MSQKVALITGVTGQDGAYLAEFLLEKGYKVYGTYRRLSTPNFWRLQYLNIFDQIELVPCDLLDSYSVIETLRSCKPDEIYNLAAQSFVGASFEQPLASGEITGLGVTRLLEGVRLIVPEAKFYQASTSEMYGDNSHEFQDENTEFVPSSPYAAAKLYAHSMVKIYREGYGLFASTGILFNHESPLRGIEFVTRKITNTVAKIKLGLENTLELGNIDARRDWGFAPEYVEAMWLMLQQDKPDDFVIATNETHTISEFLERSFERVGLNWKKLCSDK
jgi:GDPmannose 4,6-dehydratase